MWEVCSFLQLAKKSNNYVWKVCTCSSKVAILCGRCADFEMEAGGGGGRWEVGVGGEEVEVECADFQKVAILCGRCAGFQKSSNSVWEVCKFWRRWRWSRFEKKVKQLCGRCAVFCSSPNKVAILCGRRAHFQ